MYKERCQNLKKLIWDKVCMKLFDHKHSHQSKITENITKMNSIFCNSLISLPDISKWNTKNVTDMSFMFYSCESLISLPDISKWNTKNVIDMISMFSDCRSLISFPDISKQFINNKVKKDLMFNGCNEKIIPKNFN